MSALPVQSESWGPDAGRASRRIVAGRATPAESRGAERAPGAWRRVVGAVAAIALAFALGYGAGLAWRAAEHPAPQGAQTTTAQQVPAQR